MGDSTKTDNALLDPKLLLRRHFLEQFHPAPEDRRVLDCCQGSGLIWSILRREFPLDSYMGVDLKKKPGRLTVDSVKIVANPRLNCNIIDIDTYGSPWDHWLALVPNLTQPTTIFLTVGLVKVGGGKAPHSLLRMMRLPESIIERVPNSIKAKITAFSDAYVFALPETYDLEIKAILEAFPQRNARYIGVHLAPK